MSAGRPAAALYQRILLTGGGGFVGAHLAPVLTAVFPDADRILLRRAGSQEARAGWRTVEADICDHVRAAAIVKQFKPDLIVHLAAQSSVGAGHSNAESTWCVNLGGSLALAGACAITTPPPAAFLFASSVEVYGQSFRNGVVSENSPLAPANAYGRSKAAAEQALADVLPGDTRLIIARSVNHTGPGQDERFVLPSFAAQIARIEAGHQPPELKVGSLDSERDFLDVRDVCEAYVRLVQSALNWPSGEIFNISSGSAHSIRSLLLLLQSQTRAKFQIVADPARMRPSDIVRAVAANHKIKNFIDWGPSHPIEATLAELLEHARVNISPGKIG